MKYRTLKVDIARANTQLEKTYHLITKLLNKLIAKIEQTEPIIQKWEDSPLVPSFSSSPIKHDRFSFKSCSNKELTLPEHETSWPIPSSGMDTIYEAIGNTDDYDDYMLGNTVQQNYIDESIRQLAEMTAEEKPVFKIIHFNLMSYQDCISKKISEIQKINLIINLEYIMT